MILLVGYQYSKDLFQVELYQGEDALQLCLLLMVLPYKIGGEGIAIQETEAIPHIYQGTIFQYVSDFNVLRSDTTYIYVVFDRSYFCQYWHFPFSLKWNQCASPLEMLHQVDNGCSIS